jgi:hypothetical protein
MKPELHRIDDLVHDPANVRTHNRRNIDALKASLARFGQQKPIVLDANGVVRAGNGTLEAARALGWENVWAVRSDLDGVEMTAYAIADNRTSELAEWDYEALGGVLRAMDEGEDTSNAQSLGWQAHELQNILAADWSDVVPTMDDDDLETMELSPTNSPTVVNPPTVHDDVTVTVVLSLTEEEAGLLDELAVLLSPDEDLNRKEAMLRLVRRELAR